MNKLKIRYLIDLGLLISFLANFITGIIKYPGFLSYFNIGIGSIPFVEISVLHRITGLGMGFFVLIHLILTWSTIIKVVPSFFKEGIKK